MNDTARAARKAENSTVVDRLARFGLLCRAVNWLVVGLLAADVGLGGHARADRTGALRAISAQPMGELLLVVLAVGFTGYAAWRLLQAAVGFRDEDDERKRWAKRLASAFRTGIYGTLAVSTVLFLLHGSKRDQTQPLTARVMSAPGGRTFVLLVGAGIVIGGAAMAIRGIRQKFEKKLKTSKMSEPVSVVARVVGTAGLVGRGLVFVLVGAFLTRAAVQFDPSKAKGLDAALKTLAEESYGRGLILLAATGLVAFAAWSCVEAAYRKV